MMKSLVVAAALLLAATGARAADWNLDPDHSNIGFSVKHMMVSDVVGGFDKFTGVITVDDKDVTKTVINVDIDTNSVDTRSAKRDEHLKGPDFFDASKFPKMTFKSTKVEKGAAANQLKVTGDLTLHGVTKPVVLDVTLSDEAVDPKEWGGNTHRGVKATGTINRKDFGLVWQKQLDKGGVVAGEDVALQINAELIKKK